MNSRKIFLGMIGLLAIITIGLLFSVYQANKLLEHKSNTLVGLKAKNQQLANQQTQLTQAKKDLAKYANLNDIAKTVVPQDKDQAEAVREIVNLASQSGIPLNSVTFPSSTLGNSTTTGPGGLTQVTPVKSIPGVYDLQITIQQQATNEVPYSNFIAFLSGLEQDRRTAQVSSVSVTPDPKSTNLISFTLIVDEFIKP